MQDEIYLKLADVRGTQRCSFTVTQKVCTVETLINSFISASERNQCIDCLRITCLGSKNAGVMIIKSLKMI